jgi:hypothetical protein
MAALAVLAASASAFAGTFRFSVPVTADGAALGTASALLKVTEKDKRLTWSLSEGQFVADGRREGAVVWPADVLAGSGQVDGDKSVVIKEFQVTVQQPTAVDITYSLRLRVAVDGDNIRAVSVEQAR